MPAIPFDSLQTFNSDSGPVGQFFSLPQLEKNGVGPVSRLPHSLRVVLESVLRNCDGEKITEDDVRELANWQPNGKRVEEIPVHRCACVVTGLHGRAVARRSRRDAFRSRAFGQEYGRD